MYIYICTVARQQLTGNQEFSIVLFVHPHLYLLDQVASTALDREVMELSHA
jgi:hypothetical protein